MAAGGGDVRPSLLPEESQHRVAEGGHHAGCRPSPNAAGVLTEGDIAHVVPLVLDAPRAANEVEQLRGGRGRQARDRRADLLGPPALTLYDAFDLAHLGHTRPGEVARERGRGPALA